MMGIADHTLFPIVGGGTLWTPANLTNPAYLWYDETTNVAETVTTGYCNSWDDRILGNTNSDLDNGAAGQLPLILPTGLNGMRTLRWDGSNDYLRVATVYGRDVFKNQGQGWILVVFKKTTLDVTPTTRPLFAADVGTGPVARFSVNIGQTGTGNENKVTFFARRLDADSVGSVAGSTLPDTNFHMVYAAMDWTNGDGYIWFDGVLINTNTSMTSNGNTSNTSGGAETVVGRNFTSTSFTDAEIAELIVGRTLPISIEIDKLHGRMAHKWGLQSVLPGGHPYKSTPPYV